MQDNLYIKSRNKSFLHIAIFIYWAVLVVWQNIGEYTARSSIDTIIKMGLLAWLCFWYIITIPKVRFKVRHLKLFLLFVVTQLISFQAESSHGLGIIVAYVFPSLFLFLSIVYGYDYKLNVKQYITFLNCVIAVVAYAAIYALIFKTEQFISAFSISSAYGNELTSFFMSNHEYGMYLIGGIIACIVCMEIKKNMSVFERLVYFSCLVLFIPNLVLTYSRTSMLAMAGFIFVYIFMYSKSKMRRIVIITGILVGLSVLVLPDFREFIMKIVLKDNNLAGRDDLYDLAIDYFKEGNVWQKLFGRGIGASRKYFESETTHGSVHNAYLQVLVYYGIAGVVFMVGFLVNRFITAGELMKKNRFWGMLEIGLIVVCSLLMMTNTAVLFNSPIDSFFLTAFTIVIPNYLRNHLMNNAREQNENR